MVDFDAARRTLTAAKSMKKPDENKMTKVSTNDKKFVNALTY